jgi:uncharacterized delta-60 repeat protein
VLESRILLSAGDLDPTFGTGGKVSTRISDKSDIAAALALQPDGKIVVAGTTSGKSGTPAIGLVRYNPDGSVDTSFGTGGTVVTPFPNGQVSVAAMALQPDGKIVLGCSAIIGIPFVTAVLFAAVRYNENGTLDTSFGTGGFATAPTGPAYQEVGGVALQTDGKIIVSGVLGSPTGPVQQEYFGVIRYNPNGSLDTSFGNGGMVETPSAFGSQIKPKVIVQPDGKIVISGGTVVLRLNPDGSFDPLFGNGGKTTPNIEILSGQALALQPDGKIILAGGGGTAAGGGSDFVLSRYNVNGLPDPTFGINGVVESSVTHHEVINDIVVQTDGKIVAAGGASGAFGLARYTANGSLDSSFGTQGTLTTSFMSGGTGETAKGIVLQPDGKVVVAGSGIPIGVSFPDFDVARYLGDDRNPNANQRFVMQVSVVSTLVGGRLGRE